MHKQAILAFFLLATFILSEGCVSFYSGSVLGHDAAEVPFPDQKSGGTSADFALSTKVSPTTSYFTRDSTLSGVLSASAFTSFYASENARFCVGIVGSGYVARTSIYLKSTNSSPGSESTNQNILASSGLAAELKTGFILDPGKRNSIFTGLDFIYNQEFGDYLDFRRRITGSDDRYIFLSGQRDQLNLSPAGTTLETYFFIGSRFRIAESEFIDALYSPGIALTNFPNEFNFRLVDRITAMYSLGKVWWSCSIEDLRFLNLGLGIGFGVRI